MGVALNLDYGFNRYFSVKSTAIAYFLGEMPDIWYEETETYGVNTVRTYSESSGRHYNGLGLDILGKASYPFKRIIPHVALGGGYAYFTQEVLWTHYSLDSTSQGWSSVELSHEKQIHLFFLNAEAGITLLIQNSIGFNFSVIYSHALKQSFRQNPKYRTISSSDTTLPEIYQNITSSSLRKVDSLDLPPIYYIQAGFVFRFN